MIVIVNVIWVVLLVVQAVKKITMKFVNVKIVKLAFFVGCFSVRSIN